MSGWAGADIALAMRDTIEKIAEGVINRKRPESFAGQVIWANIFTKKALVKPTGAKDESEYIEANFTNIQIPNFADNQVEVSGTPGNYWITKIYHGGYRIADSWIHNLRWTGGNFGTTEGQSNFLIEGIGLPAVGNAIHLGRWSNEGMTLWSTMSATLEFDVTVELFTNIKKHYVVELQQDDDGGIWKTVLPENESGIVNGLDFAVEVKADSTGVELRFRYLRAGAFGTAGPNLIMTITGQNFTYSAALANTEQADARPTEVFGRNIIGASEINTLQQGPFYAPTKHTVENRMQAQLFKPPSISWDNVNLLWTGEWVSGGWGKGELSSGGVARMGMPAAGVIIPVHGSTAITSVTVVAGGIPMRTAETEYVSLYYEPAYFAAGASNTGRYHLVGTSNPFKIPSHWIFLAMTNGTAVAGNSLLLGDGSSTDHWKVPSLNAGISAVDSLGYRKIGPYVEMRGGVIVALAAGSNAVFTLPAGYRPTTLWAGMLQYSSATYQSGACSILNTGVTTIRNVTNGTGFEMHNVRYDVAA